MATFENIVESLMQECGKTAANVRAEIAQQVEDVVVEMLSQGSGKFEKLKKSKDLSILTTTKKYKLPDDFNVPTDSFWEVDDEGDFVREIFVVNKKDYATRATEGTETNARMCYMEFDIDGADGRGDYLVLAADPAEATTYRFEYYRIPTGSDVDIISDVTLLKRGVRGGLPSLFVLTAPTDLQIYMGRIGKYSEKRRGRIRQIITKPAKNVRNRNLKMHDYGAGR